jgi:DNA-binding CsgD family transcriptional regulator
MPAPETLSEREREVLRLVATGATNEQIARQLSISVNTVKVHLRNIFAKLGVASRTEASLLAIREGWVVLEPVSPPPPENPTSAPAVPRPFRLAWPRWAAVAIVALLGVGLAFLALSRFPGRWSAWGKPSPSPVGLLSAQRWAIRSAMPTPRREAIVVPVGGMLYALGGIDSKGVSTALERFDPINNRWEVLPPKPTGVVDAQAAVLSERIYVPGGKDAGGNPVALTEVYDVGLGRWRPAASLPRPLAAYALVAFEGRLLLFGGWDGTRYRDEILRYTPEDDRWDEVARLPFPWGEGSAVVTDDHILLLGGPKDSTRGPTLIEFGADLASPEEHPLPPEVVGNRFRAVALTSDLIYLLAEGEGDIPPSLWQYRHRTGTWQRISQPVPNGLPRGAAIAGYGTQIYILGGQTDGRPLALTQEYQALFTIVIPAPTP